MRIGESGYGIVEFDGNEHFVSSKNYDPAKYRVASPINEDGGGGGVISFNVGVSAARQEEIAMIRVEQDERVRGQEGNLSAEMNIQLRNGSEPDADRAMVKPIRFLWDRVVLDENYKQSLREQLGSLPAGEASGRPPFKMLSENGRFELILQNDGPFAIYDYSRPAGDRLVWASSNCVMRK